MQKRDQNFSVDVFSDISIIQNYVICIIDLKTVAFFFAQKIAWDISEFYLKPVVNNMLHIVDSYADFLVVVEDITDVDIFINSFERKRLH